MENAFTVFAGGVPRAFPVPSYMENIFNVAGLTFSASSITVPIVTMILLLGILYVLYKTKYGMAIRALSFDIKTVNLMGVDANMIIAIVFGLGSALAAVGGIFWR